MPETNYHQAQVRQRKEVQDKIYERGMERGREGREGLLLNLITKLLCVINSFLISVNVIMIRQGSPAEEDGEGEGGRRDTRGQERLQ